MLEVFQKLLKRCNMLMYRWLYEKKAF